MNTLWIAGRRARPRPMRHAVVFSVIGLGAALAGCSTSTPTAPDAPPATSQVTAVAGADQRADVGVTIQLDGSSSSGASLLYRWTRIHQSGVSSAPASHSAVGFSFVLDEPDSLVYELGVASGVAADADTVVVRSNPPSITSFSPTSGGVGARVTVSGANFSPTPERNHVHFGDMQATVLGAGVNSLEVECPAGATSGPIKVTVLGTDDEVTSSSEFQVIVEPPPAGPWETQGVPNDVTWLEDVFAWDADRAWAVGVVGGNPGKGAILRTLDGETWEVVKETSAGLTSVHFSDPLRGVAVGRGFSIYRTEDGGDTWVEDTSVRDTGLFSGDFQDVVVSSVDPTGPLEGWAVGADLEFGGVVFHTADVRQGWGLQAGAPGPDRLAAGLYGVSSHVEGTQTAVGWQGGMEKGPIFHTTDGGQTWAPRGEYGDFLFSVHLTGPREGWAVGSDGDGNSVIRYTADGWQTVENTAPSSEALLTSVHFVSGLGIVVGHGGVIWRTGPAGAWVSEENPVGPVNFMGVHAVDAETAWAVGNLSTQTSNTPVILKRVQQGS